MNDFSNVARPTGIQWHGPNHGLVQFGEDSRLVVLFFTKSIRNDVKSHAAGTPIHEDQTFIRIHEPGERLNVVERPVTEADRVRFPVQWSRYVQKLEQRPDGTPIDLLFPNHPAIADNLKSYGVYTVQQCSNLSANAIDNIGMGAQEYVNMAKKYLDNANSGVVFHEMQAKLKEKDQEIKIMSQKFSMLQKQFEALNARLNNPGSTGVSPPWQEGFDAPTERINTNHPSQEIAAAKQKGRKKAYKVEDAVADEKD